MKAVRFAKKLISLLLCAVLLTAFVPYVCAKAANPVVFVAGYTGSRMVLYRGTPEETRVWKQRVADKVVDAIKSELPGIVFDAGAAAVGCYDKLFDKLEPYVEQLIDPLRMNDDGSSKYPVEVYPHSVQTTRLDALSAIGYYPDHDALKMLGAAAGNKNVYCCTLDWRLGQIDNAAVLDAYIRDVLRTTGADKVDLMGVSFGGQVVTSYLTLYGGDHVARVVLQCPALDGSSIVPQLLSGDDFSIGWTALAELVRAFRKDETDYADPAVFVRPSLLCRFLRAFIDRFLSDLFLNYGSVWDLVPSEVYPSLRDRLLSDPAHAVMWLKSDRYHNEIAAKTKETLRALSDDGVQIAIVAGYGYALAVDNGNLSDGVIDLASMTGAECAAVGQTLDAERMQKYGVSADGMVDTSVGYLPERTWYVSGMLHGMGANESKVSALMTTLLLTDTIADVYALPEYPQFMSSQNQCRGVFSAFSGCAEGYCTPYSTQLFVTNLSASDSILIDSILCDGADLRFSFTRGTVLQPGGSMTAAVSGIMPEQDHSAIRISVRYVVCKEKYSVARSRTQAFRFANDDSADTVLTIDKTGADLITDTPAVRNGRLPIKAVMARILAYLYDWKTMLVRIIRGISIGDGFFLTSASK